MNLVPSWEKSIIGESGVMAKAHGSRTHQRRDHRRPHGFEDREGHRAPSAPVAILLRGLSSLAREMRRDQFDLRSLMTERISEPYLSTRDAPKPGTDNNAVFVMGFATAKFFSMLL